MTATTLQMVIQLVNDGCRWTYDAGKCKFCGKPVLTIWSPALDESHNSNEAWDFCMTDGEFGKFKSGLKGGSNG